MGVHDQQPLTGSEPVFDAPNLLLTPHIAGITGTSLEGMSRGSVDTMLALLRDLPIDRSFYRGVTSGASGTHRPSRPRE